MWNKLRRWLGRWFKPSCFFMGERVWMDAEGFHVVRWRKPGADVLWRDVDQIQQKGVRLTS
ncbi:MAG TPA: hypothetical protein VM243_17975 [Phycisphaerae bacterium]|nr:hypothetical protein [Phycisphaerae bacterium]